MSIILKHENLNYINYGEYKNVFQNLLFQDYYIITTKL